MKKLLLLPLICFFYFRTHAQVFDVDTILYNGHPDKYINIVVIPDGFTQQQLSTFVYYSGLMANDIFSREPYKSYKNYFNFFTINVPSAESGINHPKNANDEGNYSYVPYTSVDNYFKSSLDRGGIHRSVGPLQYSQVIGVLADNIPQYDYAIILNNSNFYAGTATANFANLTTSNSFYNVLLHELGHSFGKLADEYWPENGLREAYNATQNSDPQTIKWKEWLGTDAIGIFRHCCGSGSNTWYKPHENCIMQSNSAYKYCSVCREGVIEQIHSVFWPVENIAPDNSNVIYIGDTGKITFKVKLNQPSNPTIKSYWLFAGDTIAGNGVDSVVINLSHPTFKNIYNEVTFEFIDTNAFLKESNHFSGHRFPVIWRLMKDCKTLNLIPFTDTTVCEGSVIKIPNTYPGAKYWSTNDTTSSILVAADKSKELWTFIDDAGYTCYDTVWIKTLPFLQSLSKDTTLCEGLNATLTDKLNTAGSDSTITRKWFTGDSSRSISVIVDTTTHYWVSFTQNNTVCYDTLKIKVSPKINTSPILGPVTLKPDEKAVYRVDSSSNYFNWYVTNAHFTTVQYKPHMEIMAKKSGQITLKVVEKNGYCADSSALLIDIVKPAGVDDNMANNAPLFYPNPSQGIIFYDLKGLKFTSVILLDLTGKEVLNYNPLLENTGVIDISELSNGVYTLSLVSSDAVLTYKILINK